MIAHLRGDFRVILASIRNLGDCPCPRCLVPISLAHNFGTSEDIQQRIDTARVDDQSRQKKISKARKLIYGKFGGKKNTNYGVNSAAVERLLKEQSLVPTEACSLLTKNYVSSDYQCYRTPFQIVSSALDSICFQCLLLTYFMKLK